MNFLTHEVPAQTVRVGHTIDTLTPGQVLRIESSPGGAEFGEFSAGDDTWDFVVTVTCTRTN